MSTLHVVFRKFAMTGWNPKTGEQFTPYPKPVNKYVAAGGTFTDDIQKAQIFGWARAAKSSLAKYEANPEYEVIPVEITKVIKEGE